MAENEILTVEQVAEYLKVNPQTVRRMAIRGELPAKKVGRGWRFTRANIDAYMNTDIEKELRDKLAAV